MHINSTLSKKILAWYDNNKRTLPWRVGKKSPKNLYYRLLSEFMLQQTQVKTVVPFFNKFTKKFKTLNDLSKSNEKEILKCNKINNKINCYAKRYAAKEAFSKALGTGISNGIKFNEIVVLNKKSGKPYININGQTKIALNKKFKGKKSKISLSLSDEKKYAVAFVTISL